MPDSTSPQAAPAVVHEREGSDSRVTTDLDLPPAYRTQANMWQAMYFQARRELVNANKGIARLKRRVPWSPANRVMARCGSRGVATCLGLSPAVLAWNVYALYERAAWSTWMAAFITGVVLCTGLHGFALWVCFRQKNQNMKGDL